MICVDFRKLNPTICVDFPCFYHRFCVFLQKINDFRRCIERHIKSWWNGRNQKAENHCYYWGRVR